MRYPQGAIVVSRTRDVPVLEQILRSGFVTGRQLFEFMQLSHCERSRPAFLHRLRRLIAHGLVESRPGLMHGGERVYSITNEGASFLVDLGEPYAGRKGGEAARHSAAHWLDLNEVHLALWKTGVLVHWTPASEICSLNDLTQFRYAKDYDAVVAVKCGLLECRFALEYERTPKTYNHYQRICDALDHEMRVETILYLASNYHLMCFLRDSFMPRRRKICVALLEDFRRELLQTPVMLAGRQATAVRFQQILQQAHPRRH